MLIIWHLFPLLDEQTNTISFHTKTSIYTHDANWKRSCDIQITNHDSPNSWRHSWNLGHVHSCSKFLHFFANKMIHDCIGDHVTYKYPIMIQQILDVIVKIWGMFFLVQIFTIFSQTRWFMIVLVKTDTTYNTLLHPTYVEKKNW